MSTVHVKNISSQTSESAIRDFFSFCGKISSLSVSKDDTTQSAAVTFEKQTAAKTAMLLDNTQLGPNLVQVSSAASLDEMSTSKTTNEKSTASDDDLDQEDKPRSRIIAEYLAHGYTVSDSAIERALQLDQKHGISSRFTSALQDFDAKYKVTAKAADADTKLGVTDKATQGWRGLNSYFEKALGTPSGQKVHAFYMDGQKQVLDVHNEARRLANLKSGKSSTEAASSVSGASSEQVEKSGMHIVAGTTDRTACNCGGSTGACPCAPGKCSCSNCAKNPEVGSEKPSVMGP